MTYSPGPNRLTPEARRVLVAIHDLSEQRGVPPTLREITEVTGRRAWSTVAYHVTTLQRLGLVCSHPGMPRGTYLTEAGRAEVTGTPTLTDAARHLRAARAILHGLDAERIDTPLAWATVALEDILTHLEVSA
jgi:SOS-response transcriptional repressor LexA